jgi:hypothetical protein
MNRIAPSARLERKIAELLASGIADAEQLAEVGRLGAQLVLQRAVEEEVTAFLRRARYGGASAPTRAFTRWAAAGARSPSRRCAK